MRKLKTIYIKNGSDVEIKQSILDNVHSMVNQRRRQIGLSPWNFKQSRVKKLKALAATQGAK